MKFTCKGALTLLLLAGCTALETKPEFIDVQLTVNSGQTKTTLNDNHFSWTSGDRVGLFAGNIQQNVPMSHVSSNTFEGRFEPVRDDIVENVPYYAYYPYTVSVDGTTVSGRVSASQVAPFDPTNDYIFSSVETTGSYDESNLTLPALSLDWHVCSLAKIRIQNNNASYASYRLQSVTLSSASENLCGTLTFNPSNGSSSFSGSGKSIVLTYPQANRPTLGNGTLIELNAVLLPCDVHDLSITLTTDHGTATLLSDTLLEFDGNSMVVLPIITGFTLSEGGGGGGEDPERIPCVFMGDSITAFWASNRTFFSDNGFVGKGVSGQWTTHMLNRFQNDVIKLNPKAVIINGGTNDIGWPYYYPDKYPEPDVTVIRDNIASMANMAIAAGISPILTTICPNGKNRKEGIHQKILDANELIRQYANDYGLPLVDYYPLMVDDTGLYLISTLSNDGLHPNAAGYAIMEAACLPVINQVIGR